LSIQENLREVSHWAQRVCDIVRTQLLRKHASGGHRVNFAGDKDHDGTRLAPTGRALHVFIGGLNVSVGRAHHGVLLMWGVGVGAVVGAGAGVGAGGDRWHLVVVRCFLWILISNESCASQF
jgi:hypothetical protein